MQWKAAFLVILIGLVSGDAFGQVK